MAEKYTLNWTTFTDNLQFMCKDLYEEGKHSDVTLVCDDLTQFKAHKIVLNACSSVFKRRQQSKSSSSDISERNPEWKV